MNKQNKAILNVVGVLLACLQPIIWYGVYNLLKDEKTRGDFTNNGLGFVCTVSCIAFAIAILYAIGYIIKGKHPWD